MEPTQTPAKTADADSDALSINQLARMHCRERLLVTPLQWTRRQLDLLQCFFGEPCPAPPTTWSKFVNDRNGSAHARNLMASPSIAEREYRMRWILADTFCPLERGDEIHFPFDGRGRKMRSSLTLFLRNSPMTSPPIAAYIDQGRIEALRKRALKPNVDLRRDERVSWGVYRRKLKRVTPPDPVYDPYIVALLIAVAEQQNLAALEQLQSGEGCPATFTSKVLVSFPKRDFLHLYSAEVPSSLLHMLQKPALSPAARPRTSVEVTKISLEPRRSLRDRLFALLVSQQSNALKEVDDNGTSSDKVWESTKATP